MECCNEQITYHNRIIHGAHSYWCGYFINNLDEQQSCDKFWVWIEHQEYRSE